MPHTCTLEQAVDRVLSEIAGPIHLGLPLGLGKPNRWVNALYARVREMPERQLTIYTALCLARPRAGQDLQRRFLEPFVDRVYGDYPELDFLADLHSGKLDIMSEKDVGTTVSVLLPSRHAVTALNQVETEMLDRRFEQRQAAAL